MTQQRSSLSALGLLFVVAAVGMSQSPCVFAQATLQPFSGDQVMTVGGHVVAGTVKATSYALRVDDAKKRYVTIARSDKKVIWVLLPERHVYLQLPWKESPETVALSAGGAVKRKALGTDVVGDYHCDKSRTTATVRGKTFSTDEWAARELNGFVVKRQDAAGSWSVEYHNVRAGPQSASLFEIPPGYQLMELTGMQH